jgi:hypothetical protein
MRLALLLALAGCALRADIVWSPDVLLTPLNNPLAFATATENGLSSGGGEGPFINVGFSYSASRNFFVTTPRYYVFSTSFSFDSSGELCAPDGFCEDSVDAQFTANVGVADAEFSFSDSSSLAFFDGFNEFDYEKTESTTVYLNVGPDNITQSFQGSVTSASDAEISTEFDTTLVPASEPHWGAVLIVGLLIAAGRILRPTHI